MSSCLRIEKQMKAGRTVSVKGSWDAAMAIWPGADSLIQLPTDSSKHFGSSGNCRSATVVLCMAARNMLFHVNYILGWWAPRLEAVVTQCSVRLANCGPGDTTGSSAERGMI